MAEKTPESIARILTEKIREQVYKENLKENMERNACMHDIYKNRESANENLPNNCRTLTLKRKLNENKNKVLMSKSNTSSLKNCHRKSVSDETCIINFNNRAGHFCILKWLGIQVQSESSLGNKSDTDISTITLSSSDNEGNSADDEKSNESSLSRFEAKDDIFKRKAVDLVKSALELKQKMQRENMKLPHSKYQNIVKSEPVTSSLNEALNKVCSEIKLERNKAIEISHDEGEISSTTMSNTNIIDQAVEVILVNELGKEVLEQSTGLKDKVLRRVIAKIEEKERKKREKYEFKKKIRNMKKRLFRELCA